MRKINKQTKKQTKKTRKNKERNKQKYILSFTPGHQNIYNLMTEIRSQLTMNNKRKFSIKKVSPEKLKKKK